MHELPFLQEILTAARRHRPPAQRVTAIYVRVDEATGFVDDSVQFYWDILTETEPHFHGTRLVVERIPTPALCYSCHQLLPTHTADTPCPQCGSYRVGLSRDPVCEITGMQLTDI